MNLSLPMSKSNTLSHTLESKYKKITVNLNNQCNLRCAYCFIDKENKFMNKRASNVIIEHIPSLVEDGGEIHFFGTEPLLSFNVLRYIVKKLPGYKFGITTNGTLINRENALFLAEHNIGVLLSCDGDRTANHQRVTVGGQPSFDDIIRGWNILLEVGITPAIAATVTTHNVHLLLESAKFLLSRPQNFVHFNFDTTHSTISHMTMYKYWSQVVEWYVQQPKDTGVLKNVYDAKKQYTKSPTKRSSRVTCGACHGSSGIDMDGALMPCHRDNLRPIGQITENDIVLFSDIINDYKQKDFNECHSCPAYPCSTCYSNFKDATGNEFEINEQWCKIQLMKWQVYRQFLS